MSSDIRKRQHEGVEVKESIGTHRFLNIEYKFSQRQ